jgi:hypothetical protein
MTADIAQTVAITQTETRLFRYGSLVRETPSPAMTGCAARPRDRGVVRGRAGGPPPRYGGCRWDGLPRGYPLGPLLTRP